MTTDPFQELGLRASMELTDDDVRAAWRRIAAATHPDRPDGGDPERFAAAAAAYTVLRTGYGRGEARADLATSHRRGGRLTARLAGLAGSLTARAMRGRPALLAARVALAAAASAAAFGVTGASPAAAGLTTGALTWLLLGARHDLAPPPPAPRARPAQSGPSPGYEPS